MEWTSEERGGAIVIGAVGKIDESNWQVFLDALSAGVDRAKAAALSLIVDFSGIDYMSSRGLRALTLAKKAAGADVAITLAGPNARMREIFAISRYDKIFPVVDAV